MENYCEACIFGRGKHSEDCEYDEQRKLHLEHARKIINAVPKCPWPAELSEPLVPGTVIHGQFIRRDGSITDRYVVPHSTQGAD